MTTAYETLIGLLEQNSVPFRVIDHPPEGRTEAVSLLRGHPVDHAVKCIILIVKKSKKETRFVLAVVRGNARVDIQRIREIFRATYVGFAATDVAERLAGSPPGTVLPFSFSAEMRVIADRSILALDQFYFNAARLDRSIAMKSTDFILLASPEMHDIALKT